VREPGDVVRRLGTPLVFGLCLLPMAVIWGNLLLGNVRGEWIKTVTHETGQWGLGMITATLAVTPIRRVTGWNAIQGYRRMLGLFGFLYITVHFLIYLVLDQFFDLRTIVEDLGKRPYITIGFLGFLLMVPLAITSTKGWVRRLGRRWVTLHSLVYLTALAGVVHYAWAVKKDLLGPTLFAGVLLVLFVARLAPRGRGPVAACRDADHVARPGRRSGA
jgi:sulfoxide reductase heme-binding subunit YedZ